MDLMTKPSALGHGGPMTTEPRTEAEQELVAASAKLREAQAELAAAKARAAEATRAAKRAGISQHGIVRVMGEEWAKENNPQYPPALDLEREIG